MRKCEHWSLMENSLNSTEEKLIIAAFREGILSCSVRDHRIVRLNFERENSSLVGNIYVGRVQRILRNLEAAFLDLGETLPAYCDLKTAGAPVYTDSTVHTRLREGDEILVRVKKDAHKTKGPLVSARFSPPEAEELLSRAAYRKAPALLYGAPPFWKRLAEHAGRGQSKNSGTAAAGTVAGIITDIPHVYTALTGAAPETEPEYRKKLPEAFRPAAAPRYMKNSSVSVRFHESGRLPLSALWSLETAVKEATERKIWLKSGGSLVIDPVEAMTVIDVNTAKTTRGRERQETIRRTDSEAAAEIMRQLQLRNLSGMILADFIDLRDKADRDALMEQLRTLAAEDPVPTQIVDITRLHLVEITRQKSGKTLAEQLREAGGK